MKLNLLPTYVSKEKQGALAVIGAVVLAAVGLGLMIFLTRTSREAVQKEQDRINNAKPTATQAVDISKQADDVITQNRGLILNMLLADEMQKHSKVYPELYDEVRKYIPGFFRISSMNAIPNGPDSATVTMTGYISTFQEYADLMVALLRIPGATAVSRSGFQLNDPLIPNIVTEDQVGRKRKAGDPVIPDNPMDRLDLQIANATVTGFDGSGNFGSTDKPMVRGAMPTQSTITVAVVIAKKNLQTPDPRATLAQAASLWGGSPETPAPGATPGPTTPAPGNAGGQTNNTPAPANASGGNKPAASTTTTNNPPASKGPNRKNPAADQGDE